MKFTLHSESFRSYTDDAFAWVGKALSDESFSFDGNRLCVSIYSTTNLAPSRINALADVSVSAAA